MTRSCGKRSLGLLAIGLLTLSCGGYGGGSPSTPNTQPGAAANVVITINGINGNMSFDPNPATVNMGQTVAWNNMGGQTHTATQDTGGFNTGVIGNGTTSNPITMNTAGSFAYHCSIHPTMVATLIVR